MIQAAINKFHGFYNQFDGKSGFSENDKVISLYVVDEWFILSIIIDVFVFNSIIDWSNKWYVQIHL